MKALRQDGLLELLQRAPVVPVIVVHRLADAVPLARALVAGGLPVLEFTLRTPVALEALMLVRAEVRDAVCGVGTVLRPEQLVDAARAGAAFAVAPGATDRLLDAAADVAVPVLPGAATASEVMALLERGVTLQKFFPAEPAGRGVRRCDGLADPRGPVLPHGRGEPGERGQLPVAAERAVRRRVARAGTRIVGVTHPTSDHDPLRRFDHAWRTPVLGPSRTGHGLLPRPWSGRVANTEDRTGWR